MLNRKAKNLFQSQINGKLKITEIFKKVKNKSKNDRNNLTILKNGKVNSDETCKVSLREDYE